MIIDQNITEEDGPVLSGETDLLRESMVRVDPPVVRHSGVLARVVVSLGHALELLQVGCDQVCREAGHAG